ncbi:MULTISPECIES: RDD family protein [unclassified Rhizobium]|uniref:RDD family protein n=1 Tax=unclassified Rhizobium TaxID=2613769 RepID=UPI001ADAD50B|nr:MULTISPECIES: RDD family protein [unclassified Rhizobium]MBO9098375.1 RDD family protein [Rhizobium sp. L58/93]MBO9132821.1 RDD family protein [Rhizobium sp. B209b/85]MBO9168641.1 RDD family protein [Rhizobium sp. L245/93]MBO9184591.1 RDD family protein [Rhizobium sp. E27B/91]QXZ84772.1 RDD family protein [Rhizobium sp. K1/93]
MSDALVPRNPSTWRRVLALILDLITAFFGLGYLVALLTGGMTEDGFQLNGWPAMLLFALVIAYFVIANRFFGGTIWKYILKART